MLDKNQILERTRELVITSGISYAALADRCGVNEKTISRLLNGSGTEISKNPSFMLLCGIITACGGSVDEVIGVAPVERHHSYSSNDPLVAELRSEIMHERSKVKLWSTLFVVLALAVISVFVYDAFNPHIGWIRYTTQAAYSIEPASAQLLARIVSRVTGHAL